MGVLERGKGLGWLRPVWLPTTASIDVCVCELLPLLLLLLLRTKELMPYYTFDARTSRGAPSYGFMRARANARRCAVLARVSGVLALLVRACVPVVRGDRVVRRRRRRRRRFDGGCVARVAQPHQQQQHTDAPRGGLLEMASARACSTIVLHSMHGHDGRIVSCMCACTPHLDVVAVAIAPSPLPSSSLIVVFDFPHRVSAMLQSALPALPIPLQTPYKQNVREWRRGPNTCALSLILRSGGKQIFPIACRHFN